MRRQANGSLLPPDTANPTANAIALAVMATSALLLAWTGVHVATAPEGGMSLGMAAATAGGTLGICVGGLAFWMTRRTPPRMGASEPRDGSIGE